MKKNTQQGFSLIELLIVVTIIGIIASIGIPSLQKGVRAARNASAISVLRTMIYAQTSYYSTNNRFARLSELNTANKDAFGITQGETIIREKHRYTLNPPTTDEDLKQGFTIVLTETGEATDITHQYIAKQSGEIVQIAP